MDGLPCVPFFLLALFMPPQRLLSLYPTAEQHLYRQAHTVDMAASFGMEYLLSAVPSWDAAAPCPSAVCSFWAQGQNGLLQAHHVHTDSGYVQHRCGLTSVSAGLASSLYRLKPKGDGSLSCTSISES